MSNATPARISCARLRPGGSLHVVDGCETLCGRSIGLLGEYVEIDANAWRETFGACYTCRRLHAAGDSSKARGKA